MVSIIKSNIIDIYDSATALTADGEMISLNINYYQRNSIVQKIQSQTDKYLAASHLGLKNGKLYDFSDVENAKEVTKGKIKKLTEDQKSDAVAIYSETNDEIR